MTPMFDKNKMFASISYAEFWDRVNFYGLQAVLVVYLVKYFQLSDQEGYSIYGIYTALSFGFTILGGLIADKILGCYFSTLLGGLLISCANLILSIPDIHAMYIGLSIMVIGIGLFKPNNPNLLGKLFGKESLRRTKAFSIFYLCINVGSIFGPIFYGVGSSQHHYWWGFLLSSMGMLSAVYYLYVYRSSLKQDIIQSRKLILNALLVLALCVIFSVSFFKFPTLFDVSLMLAFILAIVFLIKIFNNLSCTDREALILLIVPVVGCIIYFASFLQIYSSITIFIDRNIDRHFLNWVIPTTWFSSLQPCFIILMVPVLNFIWSFLNRKQIEPSPQGKVVVGLFVSAISFFIFAISAAIVMSNHYLTLALLIAANVLLAISELCVIPITMSFANLVAPKKYQGTIMGIFYFSLTISGYLSGHIAKFTTNNNEQQTGILNNIFFKISILLLMSALILTLINKGILKYKRLSKLD